jgi:hypothetical protein
MTLIIREIVHDSIVASWSIEHLDVMNGHVLEICSEELIRSDLLSYAFLF